MRFIVAILCFMALINGANASFLPDTHDKELSQVYSTHSDNTHDHSDHARLGAGHDGKCHAGCSMLSAIVLRRHDEGIVVEKHKTQLYIFSYLSALYKLFDVSSLDRELSWFIDKTASSLPVYALTQRLRI